MGVMLIYKYTELYRSIGQVITQQFNLLQHIITRAHTNRDNLREALMAYAIKENKTNYNTLYYTTL